MSHGGLVVAWGYGLWVLFGCCVCVFFLFVVAWFCGWCLVVFGGLCVCVCVCVCVFSFFLVVLVGGFGGFFNRFASWHDGGVVVVVLVAGRCLMG